MIAAAAAAMGVVGYAADGVAATTTSSLVLKTTQCINCGYTTKGGDLDCQTVVFKVTGSGKAALDKGSYKTVGSIKIKKGALAIVGDKCLDDGRCCYERGIFFAKIKAGKKTFDLMSPINVKVWSIFGKNLEKARNWETSIKPGKSVCLDSALFITTPWQADCVFDEYTLLTYLDWDGDVALADLDDIDDWTSDVDVDTKPQFAFWASAFGKVDWKVTSMKESKKYCKNTSTGCEPIITPKTYSGWFVGTYLCVNAENCFMCDCPDLDVFGGTWKAVYQKKVTTISGAMNLAGVRFALPTFSRDEETGKVIADTEEDDEDL